MHRIRSPIVQRTIGLSRPSTEIKPINAKPPYCAFPVRCCDGPHRSFRPKIRNRVTKREGGGEKERKGSLLLPRSIEFGSSETDSAAKPWPRSGGSKKGTRRCNGSGNFWGREGVIHGGGSGVWVGVAGSIQGGFVVEYESATTTLAFCSFFLFSWEITSLRIFLVSNYSGDL